MNFLKRYKKLFLVILFILIIILFATLLWRTFFVPLTPQISTPEETLGTIGGLPEAGIGDFDTTDGQDPQQLSGESDYPEEQTPEAGLEDREPSSVANGSLTQITSISGSATIGATISKNGDNVQYYDPHTGLFHRIDSQGNVYALSDRVFHSVENVSWSPDKEKAILEYPDGSNIIYDFETQTQVTLPKHWEDFGFSPQSDQVVAKSLGLDPENRYLITSGVDGSTIKAIEYIGNNDDTVYPTWSPNNQVAAIYTEGLDFDRQEMFFIGFNGENFKSATIEGRGLQAQWSEDGDRLLYSVYNSHSNLMPQLWIVNSQGDDIGANRTNLNVQTWADKCNFSNDRYIYCAVPEDLPEGSGLFPELALRTKDNLYKIDSYTGTKTLIAIPNGYYNISNLIITDDESELYFTDEGDQEVYQIKLK